MREEFFRAILPNDGYFCLFTKNNNEEFGKQRFYDSVDELLDAANNYTDTNVFFGVAGYRENTSRLASNVDSVKSFFLDLDAKDFGSKAVALQELKAFCKDVGLPTPFIVDSGRGIHAYWPLSQSVGRDEWARVATRLKKLCAEKEFKADPAVTADAARILRLPGSMNMKGSEPLPCTILRFSESQQRLSIDEFADVLGYTFIPDPVLIPAGFEGLADPLTENLGGNIESDFHKINAETGCAQIVSAVDNSDALAEPVWRAALSIAVRCIDADEAITAVSDGHPDFDLPTAKRKAEQTKGPYTCEAYESLNPALCKACKHRGKVKSPIVLGKVLNEPEIEDGFYKQAPIPVAPVLSTTPVKTLQVKVPQLPSGYALGKQGGIYIKDVDPDGNVDYKMVSPHTLYAAARTYDPEAREEALVMRVHMPMDGIRTFPMPNSTISSSDKCRETLARHGVLPPNQNELRKYIMKWVEHFQYSAAAKRPIRQYGWLDNTCTEFVLGETLFTLMGAELALPSERTAPYNPYFDPKGSLQGWCDTMKLWEDPRFVQQQYAMGVGFGSVLMQMDETNASILHLHSKESGVGKTAILRAITSIWGNPDKLIMKRDDTLASKMQRCEIYHNLPIALDEITNMKSEDASDMIYQLTGGQQRSRMNASANEERVRGESWSLMAITTGNTSLIDIVCGIGGKMSPQAEGQRVLEMYVSRQFIGSDSKRITDAFSNGLRNHYGHAGAVFIEFLLHNPAAVRKVVDTVRDIVDLKGNLSSENRFWSAQITYSVAGLILASKAGLVHYDHKRVLNWAINNLLEYNKQNVTDMITSASDVVSEYLAEHLGNILQVKDNGDIALGDNSVIPPPEEKVRIRMVGRYEYETGKLFLLTTPFKSWCTQRQIPYRQVIAELEVSNNAVHAQKRLDTGIKQQFGTGTKLPLEFDSKRAIVIDWRFNNEADGDD